MADQSDLRNHDFIVPPTTPAQANAARRACAAHAHDADDLRDLLTALGLETA